MFGSSRDTKFRPENPLTDLLNLNEMQDNISGTIMIKESARRRRSPDKNRYVLSKATQEEFNLKSSDIPTHMREESDEQKNFTNHVDENIRVIKSYNDMNKHIYLRKLKFNIENQLVTKQRAQANEKEKQHMFLKRSQKWDDFRKRKAEVLGRYLEVKKVQKSV